MKSLKRGAIAATGVLALLMGGTAQADLLEYSFSAVDGSQRTLSPGDTYANPSGPITFALSAGVDRKVRLSIISTSGDVVVSKTSKLLGANDRITAGGKDYYGAFLSIAGLNEGKYSIKSEILSAQGLSVQSETESLVVDTTAPSVGDFSWSMDYGRGTAPDGLPIFSTTQARHISLSGVSDSLSGIGSVNYKTLWEDGPNKGEVAKTGEVTYYQGDKKAMLGSGAMNSGAQYALPGGVQSKNRIRFEVKDKAGNTASKDFSFYNNSSCGPAPELVAIEDPTYSGSYLGQSSFKGFRPVESLSSVPVNKNPLKAVYKVPRTAYRGLPEGAIFGGVPQGITDHGLKYKDSQYAYFMVEGPAGTDGTFNWNAWGWTNYHTWRCSPFRIENPQFNSQSKPPKWTGISAYIDGLGWVGSSYGNPGAEEAEAPRNTRISKIRVDLESRAYTQTVSMYESSCDVPAGKTQCTMNVNLSFNQEGTVGYYHTRPAATKKDNPGLLSQYSHVWEWDAEDPVVNNLVSHDKVNKTVIFNATESNSGYTWNRVRLAKGGLTAKQGDKVIQNFDSRTMDTSGDNSILTNSYKGLPDGTYDIYGWVEDNYGNRSEKKLLQVANDNTGPSLKINTPDSGEIRTLDEITIDVTDNFSESPKISSVNMKGGPASDDIYLSVRKESESRYRLEYPVVFPSLKEGEEYRITVVAEDDQLNETSKTTSFTYNPPQVSLADGMDGKLMIPAVTQEFKRLDGGSIIQTNPLTLSDGSTVSGTYDVFATLRSDAEVPLVVNGIRIEPGQTMSVMSQHDFSTSGGRIDLPLRPAVAGVEGSSNLLVMTSAPNSPVLVLDVNTWIGKAKLSAESWEVRQVIDPVNISASPEAGVACRLTSDVAAAQGADAVRDPVCLLEWEQTPDEAEPVEAEVGGLKLTGLQGQAVAMGEQPVSYSLYLFSGDGRKIRVGGGERTLTVTSAFGSVAYKPMGDVDEVYRVIQEFDVRMKQSMGPACTLTLDATRAQDAAANRQVGSAASTCLFEWIDIPDGMQQDSYSESPYLFGTLREQKVHTLRWRVSIFTRNGTRVTLATESYDIEAVDPPLPTVDVMSSYQYSDDLYMVPMLGGYLGDAVIEGEPSPLDVRMTRDSEVLTNETFQPGRSIYNKVFRRMETEEAALWDETVFNIEAAYNLLPEVKVEKTLRAIAVPGDDITPQIDVGVSEALDTAPLPVTVRISDRLNPEMSYDPAVMGEWAIRLVREESFDEVVPMTDFVDAPNGEVQFNLDLTGIERSVRLVAQARLKSPIEGYERIEDSQRVFMTVLRGGAIDANVEGRRLSGAAPFTTILQLELENRADMAATGDVIWEISADDGATWESHRSTDRNRFRWYRTYDKGEYLVRAKLLNVNSGAESYTETIEVIAYDTPKVEIEGARTLFVGTEATYTVKVTGPDGEPMENPVIKWTQDRGETFFHEGDTLTLTSEEAKRFSMEAWVRDATAPDDDRYAYTRERVYADFRVVKGPRVFMTGPRVIETGKEYEYLVRLSLPYKGMEGEVEGYFTLPNGEKVEGDTLTYTPTEADLALGSMELLYTAWVKGYRDQGTEASRDIRARVWEYVWPEFNLYMRSSADMAPAEVTARVREIAFRGQLDEPQYQWEFPESDAFVVTENRWDDMRTFQINEPGTYPVKVTITDARGNVAVLEETLEIGEAPPYVVEINYSASNDYNREPLELRMRPYVTGGHPRDRVEQRIYTVDGKEVESSGYSARAVLEKGSHEVGLTIRTRMGKEVTQTMTVDVAENQPPVCSVRIDDRYSSWALYAECEDVDGDMDAFEWTVNGEPVSVRSNRLTLLKSSYEDVLPRVELVGYDDAGDASAKVQAQ